MTRVVKDGGRVCFGDEGVAPWLRDLDYGKMAINNNGLWEAHPPLADLPFSAIDPRLSWVLGNCFYVIDFTVNATEPSMNPDISHQGIRGGSMRTRHQGQLEGVTEENRDFVFEDAQTKGISVHQWLEALITEKKRG